MGHESQSQNSPVTPSCFMAFFSDPHSPFEIFNFFITLVNMWALIIHLSEHIHTTLQSTHTIRYLRGHLSLTGTSILESQMIPSVTNILPPTMKILITVLELLKSYSRHKHSLTLKSALANISAATNTCK